MMTAKNKIGLARIVSNTIMSHSGILSMQILWNVLKTKQMLSLINRLNKNCEVKDITEIRIRQGQQITCCTNSIWAEKLEDIELKLLKNNLTSQIIQDNLSIGLEIIANREDWVAKVNGILIKSLIEKKPLLKQQRYSVTLTL